MEALNIIQKYYKKDSDLYNILISHSMDVMTKAIAIVSDHPELNVNLEFITEASLIHDIGIFLTDAPKIECFGIMPYLCHGYLGREIIEKEGYPEHALVCERHVGVGLTREDIIKMSLPLPLRDMIPLTIEEKIIAFADCFYSKSNLGIEKSVDEVRKGISRYENSRSVEIFDSWCDIFL